jgi:DNA-binding CsgD family transcriptional regulator
MHPYVYFQKICTLKGKTLTLREIDVIACLLSGKSIKRITAILKIEQKTVETHWQNVKNKTGLFSKDALIHYVESSGQKLFFDAHYEILLKEDVFTHEINIQKPWSVKIFTSLKEPTSRYFSELIKRHLDKIGLKSKIFVSEYLPEGVIELKNCETNRKKMIVSNQKNNGGELNYYTSLLDALIKMDSHLSVDDEKVDILYKTLCTSSLPLKKHSHFFSHLLAYYHKHWLFMLISTLFLGSVFYINCINDSKKNNTISLDKHIQRKKLDEKITECIKKQKDIAYCVLFGVVGSGKTVQARSYAKYHAPSYHFEVDSRTLDSIKKSFLQIAYMLSQTIAEKEEVEFIKKISDTHIRQNELIRFVHHLLKKNPTWYLIFDNVVHYDDIEAFIPKKTLESESGNVIFTTYNGDVLQYFEKAQCVSVGELSEKEALDLFFRICNRFEKEDVEKFLKTIPHFPLDISISASYINVNNINLLEYIDRLSKNECHDVLKKRSTILNESFSILIKKNDVYRTIICYIAFFECNAISKKLLYVLFDHEIVDAFINELKRYAFIVSDMMREDDYFFSLHPGVHDFLLTYIKDQKYIDEFSKK